MLILCPICKCKTGVTLNDSGVKYMCKCVSVKTSK